MRRCENAMVVHAAFGGSTNLLLHVPAIAHAAGLQAADGGAIGRRLIARFRGWWMRCRMGRGILLRCRCFWRAAVPEVMLHLRRAGLLDTTVMTVTGETLDANLDWWEQSERRSVLRSGCGRWMGWMRMM